VFGSAREIVVHFWLSFGLVLAYFRLQGVTFDVAKPLLNALQPITELYAANRASARSANEITTERQINK